MKRYLFSLLLLLATYHVQGSTTVFVGARSKIDTFSKGNWFPIHVTGVPAYTSDSFGFEYLNVNIKCQYTGDIGIYLYTPSGGYYQISYYNGGMYRNYDSTFFTDTALTPIHFGKPPYKGSYISESFLRQINQNQVDTGMWYLVVFDYNPSRKDILVNWSLGLGTNPNRDARIDSSNLPICVINTFGQAVPNGNIPTNSQFCVVDNGAGKMNFAKDSLKFKTYCGIKLHGNWSRSFPKLSYSINTLDSNFATKDTAILGFPKEQEWALVANYLDRSLLRNAIAQHLFTSMGNYSPRFRHVELILNGQYQGVYLFIEKIKVKKTRVNIVKMDSNCNHGDSVSGGYIIKQDWKGSWGWYSKYGKPDDTSWHAYFRYDNPSMPDSNQAKYIHEFYDSFETILHGATNSSALGTTWRNYMDQYSLMDYFFTQEITTNIDGYRASSYMWKDRNSRNRLIHMGPVWDFDITMGDYWGSWCSWFFNSGGSNGEFWWFKLLGNKYPLVPKGTKAWYNYGTGDTSFKNELKCRWTLHRRGLLSQTNLDHWIDSNAVLLKDAQVRNFKEWPVWGWPLYLGNPFNTKNYTGEVDSLKGWLHRRMKWMDRFMPGTCRRDIDPPTVKLIGKDTVLLEVNTHYKDTGIVYHDNFGDSNVKVVIGSNLDSSTLGYYVYSYFLYDKAGNSVSIQRVIKVIDTIAPNILFSKGDTIKLSVYTQYTDGSVIISDNYDLSPIVRYGGSFNFKNNIPDTLGYFTRWFYAMDQSGNKDSALLYIHVVDTTAPKILINGKDTVKIEVYNKYNDSDITVRDNYDKYPILSHFGNLKNFKTDSLGFFTLWYKAMDHSGNKDSVARTIQVIDTIPPSISLLGPDSVFIHTNDVYVDTGYVVKDNYDKHPRVDTSGTFINTSLAGIYTIDFSATDQSGNKSTYVSRIINIKQGVGISEPNSGNSYLNIYPNPGSGIFNVSVALKKDEKAILSLYDDLGRIYPQFTCTVENGITKILHMEQLNSGVYTLKLTAKNISVNSKLILTK